MPLTVEPIRAAAARIAPHAVRTPLLNAPLLDEELGFRLLVKAEPLQRTGSFKFRGALNKVLATPEAERARGFACFSSGNHGHALSAAARMVGAPAVIVMPADAPPVKAESCRRHGAEVVLYDRASEDREAILAGILAERGMIKVHPFDDPDVMAGQGTLGLEIAEQAREAGHGIDAALICCSGGGLAAGVATAVRDAFPHADLLTVEPAGFDKMRRSLEAGERVRNPRPSGSIQDALMALAPGEHTFETLRALGVTGLAVTDEEALRGMAAAFRHLRLVLEPGGAAALAAALANRERFRGRSVAVVASGGNVDPAVFARALDLAAA